MRDDSKKYEVFVSHASEDKAEFVDSLVDALRSRGLEVWYDDNEIKLGDDFRRKMDDGLARSRFGVVVVSPSFRKYWPEAELSALFNQEAVFNEKRILPVVHAMTRDEVTGVWPLLASRAAAYASLGADEVAAKIELAIRDTDAAEPAIRSLLYNVPGTRSVDFVGRQREIDELTAMLAQVGAIRVAASVEGLAGIGKTELALHLAHHLAEQGAFPGGIYWFDAENPDLTAAWGQAVADALGLPAGALAERASLAVRTLSRRNAPILIVLDNVERWGKDHKPSPLPGGVHVKYLLTTRQHSLGGAQFRHYELGFLDLPFARELLCRTAGRDVSPQPGFDDLLEHLGGHALATELAGAFLHEFPDKTPASYLAMLKEDPEVERTVSDFTRYEGTVFSAFRTIWDRLDELARKAWQVAACFEPEFVTPALAERARLDAECRRQLRRFHLIELDAQGNWRMHRLTREFGLRTGPTEALDQARVAFVTGCCEHADTIDLAAGFRVYVPDRVHLTAALEQAPRVLGESDGRYSQLLDRIGTAQQCIGELRSARSLFERALAFDLQNFGEDHPKVATSRGNLALVLRDLGDVPAARQLFEEALASDLQNFGEDHPNVAIGRANLAGVLQDLGELPAARQLLEQALASDLRNLGEDHPNVAIRRGNLAMVLRDLDEVPAARQLLEQALASFLRNFGEDHPYLAVGRANLAGVLRDLDEVPAARQLLEQALASNLRNFGEDHPKVTTSTFNLATICIAEGDLAAARQLLERTSASELRVLGREHPSLALTRANLAWVLSKLGEEKIAREEAREALRVVSSQPTDSQFRTGVERLVRRIV